MATAIEVATELEYHLCCVCGVAFAIPVRVGENRREKGGDYYCPNGHSLHYVKTEVQRLREEKAQLQEKYFAEQRRHEETMRQKEKLEKRVAKGICPCCKRTVAQLARHMKTKHPEYPAKQA